MIAIESCRTAALGGHVERCGDCGHQRVSYNSCRNTELPEVPGSRARPVAGGPPGGTARRALLPRGVHRADGDRGHRVPEPDRGLRHPVPGGVGDAAHDRRRSRSIWARRSASSAVLHTWGQNLSTTRIFIVSFPAVASRPMAKAGSPAGRGSSCRSGCCRGCSGALFLHYLEKAFAAGELNFFSAHRHLHEPARVPALPGAGLERPNAE